jgi:hypothetical protein
MRPSLQKVSAATITMMLICVCSPAYSGSEFLPFPPSQQQGTSPTANYEKQFSDAIANMDCTQLGQLHDDLVKKLNAAATDADRAFYANLIGKVTSKKVLLQGCQP